jgi:phosphoesterase RecJ-like protein
MRSKGKIDVASLASRFGGGGHKNAAGCAIEGNADQVKKMLIEAVAL